MPFRIKCDNIIIMQSKIKSRDMGNVSEKKTGLGGQVWTALIVSLFMFIPMSMIVKKMKSDKKR